MITRSATARYEGFGKEGKGQVSTQSGVLSDQQYGFGSRFENGIGTNPAGNSRCILALATTTVSLPLLLCWGVASWWMNSCALTRRVLISESEARIHWVKRWLRGPGHWTLTSRTKAPYLRVSFVPIVQIGRGPLVVSIGF